MRQYGADSLHAQIVAGYVADFPGTQTAKFERAMREWAVRNKLTLDTNLGEEWSVDRLGFRPDAFRFDYGIENITLVEAENTSRISVPKWDLLSEFFWLVDAAEWTVDLRILDRNGGVFLAHLSHVAYSFDAPDGEQAKALLARLPELPPGEVIAREDFIDFRITDTLAEIARLRALSGDAHELNAEAP